MHLPLGAIVLFLALTARAQPPSGSFDNNAAIPLSSLSAAASILSEEPATTTRGAGNDAPGFTFVSLAAGGGERPEAAPEPTPSPDSAGASAPLPHFHGTTFQAAGLHPDLQHLAENEAQLAEEAVSCASFSVVTALLTAVFQEGHFEGAPGDRSSLRYFRRMSYGGYNLDLFRGNGREPTQKWCEAISELENDPHTNVASGAEFRLIHLSIDQATEPAVVAHYFWKAAGAKLVDRPSAEAALIAAARDCATKLPVNDVTRWPQCMVEAAIAPPDSRLSFVLMLRDSSADRIGFVEADDLPLIRMTLPLTHGAMTHDITFVAAPRYVQL